MRHAGGMGRRTAGPSARVTVVAVVLAASLHLLGSVCATQLGQNSGVLPLCLNGKAVIFDVVFPHRPQRAVAFGGRIPRSTR